MPPSRTDNNNASGSARGRGGGTRPNSKRGRASAGRGGGTARGGRGRGGRGGRGARGGRTGYTPYVPPSIPSSRVCIFTGSGPHYSSALPPFDETRLDSPDLEKVHFSASFNVSDVHLDAIRARPALTSSLKALVLGDSDNGYGTCISDKAITELANACPNLVVLNLESTTGLTDDALISICQACPRLESLRITGHDKGAGRIRGKGLIFLAENPLVAPSLKDLNLMDQHPADKAVKQLSTTRKLLAISTGESLGDGFSDNMIAAMSGGAMSEVMLGGKMVSLGVDMGMYGGGGFDFDM